MCSHAHSVAGTDQPPYGVIPDPARYPTISVPTAAALVGVATRTGYMAAKRGEWPVVRTGKAVRVRTRQFLAQYGLEEAS